MTEVQQYIKQIVSWVDNKPESTLQDAKLSCLNLQRYFDGGISSESALEYALETLLDKKQGALYVIDKGEKKGNDGMAVSCDLLQCICSVTYRYPKSLNQYTSKILDTCINQIEALSRNSNAKTKENSLKLLLALTIKLHSTPEFNVKKLIKSLLQCYEQNLFTANTVKGCYYHLLGALSEYAPEHITFSKQALRLLNDDLCNEIRKESSGTLKLIDYCLKGIGCFLVNFPPEDESILVQLCESIEKLLNSQEVITDQIKIATLDLLKKHISIFGKEMKLKYQWWHETLLRYAKGQPPIKFKGCETLISFYKWMAKSLLEGESEENKIIFWYFKEYLSGEMFKENALQCDIHGLGLFGLVLKKYFSNEMYSTVFHNVLLHTLQTHNLDQTETSSHCFPDHLKCVSLLMTEFEVLGDEMMSLIEKLIEAGMYLYPKSSSQRFVLEAIGISFNSIPHPNHSSIEKIVYYSLTRQCSLQVSWDVELKTNLGFGDGVSYSNYIPLWKFLFTMGSNTGVQVLGSTKPEKTSEDLYDSFVRAILSICGKLNFSLRNKPPLQINRDFSSESGLEAEVPSDISIFVNLIALSEKVLVAANVEWFTKWIPAFINTVIFKSSKNPLISSFYKLFALVLKLSDSVKYFKEDASIRDELIYKKTLNYVRKVLLDLISYRGDLQLACLQIVTSAPVEVISPLLHKIQPALRVLFKSGISHLPIAIDGLSAVERWHKALGFKKLSPVLQDILVLLRPYLVSADSSLCKDYVAVDFNTVNRYWMRQWSKNLVLPETELFKVQELIFTLLSHLDSETCKYILSSEEEEQHLYGPKKSLSVRLPFSDIKPTLYLDILLPRAMTLALHSTDRTTRIASCELIHLIVTILLGTSAQPGSETFDSIVENITLPLLHLATDSDLVVHALFQPLIVQMTHFLSSSAFYQSKITAAFLEGIMNGLVHPSDSGIRDIAGKCLKEFVEWSTEQLRGYEFDHSPMNTNAIISIILKNLNHSSSTHRIGAALAFNNIYTIINSKEIIDKFSFSLLYIMVMNLKLYEDEDKELVIALNNLTDMILQENETLNKNSESREKPEQFSGPLLYDAVCFLLKNCSSIPQCCQKTCMVLFPKLVKALPGSPTVDSFVAEAPPSFLISSSEIPLFPNTMDSGYEKKSLKWMSCFSANLKYYIWLIGELKVKGGKMDLLDCRIIENIEIYVNEVSSKNVFTHSITCEENGQYSETEYNNFKQTILLSIFSIISICKDELVFVDKIFQIETFTQLLKSCLIQPSLLGFADPESEENVSLSEKLSDLLIVIEDHPLKKNIFDETFILTLNEKLFNLESRIPEIIRGSPSIKDREILNCITMLYRIQRGYEKILTRSKKDLLGTLMKYMSDQRNIVVIPTPEGLKFINNFLKFILLIEPNKLASLWDCILCPQELKLLEKKGAITLGEHFLGVFKETVLTPLFQELEIVTKSLLTLCNQQKINVLISILEQCHYTNVSFSSSGDKMVYLLLSNWNCLSSWAFQNEDRNLLVLSLVRHMANTKSCNNSCFQSTPIATWFFSCIESIKALNNCLPFISSLHFIAGSSEFIEILRLIESRYLTTFCDSPSWKLNIGNKQLTETLALWESLFFTLKLSGNKHLLTTIIKFSSHDDKDINTFGLATSYFMSKLSKEQTIELLNCAYLSIMEKPKDEFFLYYVRNYFISLVKASAVESVKDFYVKHIDPIKMNLETELSLQEEEAKRLLSIKAAHYVLIETMYGIVDKEAFLKKESDITENCSSFSIKERELRWSLSLLCKDVRKLKPTHSSPSYNNLWRLFQCTAYNAIISIVSHTQHLEIVYATYLFKEEVKEKDLIWENIVETNKQHDFPMVFEKMSEVRKQLTAVRDTKSEGEQTIYQELKLLRTETVTQSTLTLDCMKFDFLVKNANTSQAIEERNREFIEIELEMDVLNKHECMPLLCALIKHLVSLGHHQPPKVDEAVQMPLWMKYLRSSLAKKDRPLPVYQIILKLIYNCQEVFHPYAKYWLAPILAVIASKACGKRMNYFFGDIVVMILSWHDVAIPNSSDAENILASDLLKTLISSAPSNKTAVRKHNLELLSNLITLWKGCIKVPYHVLWKMLQSQTEMKTIFGICVVAIFLINDLEPYASENKENFLNYIVAKCTIPEQLLYEPLAEVVGLLLKKFRMGIRTEEPFFNQINHCLKSLFKSNKKQFLLMLHGIQKHFPPITFNRTSLVLDIMMSHTGDLFNLTSVCLEIIQNCIDSELICDLKVQLRQCGLLDYLINTDSKVQLAALKIAEKLCKHLLPDETLPYVEQILKTIRTSTREAKDVIYNILLGIHSDLRQISNKNLKLDSVVKSQLIYGLIEEDDNIRKKLQMFWSENHLPEKTSEAVLYLLSNVYSVHGESYFLGLLLDLILETTSKSADYNHKIFPNPLSTCEFQDLNLQLHCQAANASLAPMFVESLSSEVIRSLSSQGESMKFKGIIKSMTQSSFLSAGSHDKPEIPGTTSATFFSPMGQNIRFPKNVNEEVLVGTQKNMPRLLESDSVGKRFAESNFKKKKATKNKKQQVELMRKYRLGDVPDIEIEYSNLIQILKALAKRDSTISRLLFCSLIVGICEELKLKDTESLICFKNKLQEIFLEISKMTVAYDYTLFSSFFHSVYENELYLPPAIITEVCKKSGLEHIGVLLLESELTNVNEPPAKRIRSNNQHSSWFKLIELYLNLNEEDIIQGLFRDKLGHKELENAISAESQGNWNAALKVYLELTRETSSEYKDLFYSAIFKCMAHLSDWKTLKDQIQKQVDGNLDELWENSWNSDILLPLYFQAELQCSLEKEDDKSFYHQVMKWMNVHSDHMKNMYGEELCILYLSNKQFSFCRQFSEELLKQQLSKWHNFNTLSLGSQHNLLMKLKTLLDIHVFSVLHNKKGGVNQILAQWENDLPLPNDSLLLWDIRTSYREFFADLLHEQLYGNESQDFNYTNERLNHVKFRMYDNLYECALKHKNFKIARKCIAKTKHILEHIKDDSVRGSFVTDFKVSQAHLIQSSHEKEYESKFERIIKAWKSVCKLNENQRNAVVHQHVAKLASQASTILYEQPKIVSSLDKKTINNLFFCLNMSSESCISRPQDMLKRIHETGLESLKLSVKYSERNALGEAHLKMYKYCCKMKKNGYPSGQMIEPYIIKYLLRSMALNNLEARQLFPVILDIIALNKENTDLFTHEVSKVPDWMFLPWLPQLLGCLDTPIVNAIGPLVLRLAESYPTLLQVPFTMTKEKFSFSQTKTQYFIDELSSLLLQKKPIVNEFLEALHGLCYPVNLLYNYIESLIKIGTQKRSESDWIFGEMMNKCFRRSVSDQMRGKLYERNNIYKRQLHTAYDLFKTGNSSDLINLRELIKQSMKTDKPRLLKLKDFCPWLANFKNNMGDIEVPSQFTLYSTLAKPSKSVMLVGFLPTVKVVTSLRCPVLLTMVGSDGIEYPWLMKFGEDLRQDQRVQQLLQIVQYSLKAKPQSSHLNVNTYAVVPLSCNHGLIQWVKGTKTLKDFMTMSLTVNENNTKCHLVTEHQAWINGASKSKSRDWGSAFASATLHYTRSQVINKFTELKNCLPSNILRRCIFGICDTPELYYKLRTEFLRSHAVICICNWLLGIGDRHHGNTLVCLRTCQLVNIDFGYAFGAATQFLPIPELIPFRLTPQILNLCEPLYETGLIRETMLNCLTQIKKQLILAAMQVFIQEPTLDWTSFSRKQAEDLGGETLCTDWLPQRRLAIAEQKLNGGNPMDLMCEELNAGHSKNEAVGKYCSLVRGEESSKRSSVSGYLTCQQQVDCLIELATDKEILGLTWSPFESWI